MEAGRVCHGNITIYVPNYFYYRVFSSYLLLTTLIENIGLDGLLHAPVWPFLCSSVGR